MFWKYSYFQHNLATRVDKAAIQEAYNEVMADNNNVEWSVKKSYSWNCSIKSVITFTFVVATLLCHVCYVTSDQVNKLSNSKLRLFEIKTKFDCWAGLKLLKVRERK